MFDLNYKTKLKQIEGVLNCWYTRNLSLISNICVIKTILLPQLLYLFSVLCIEIPKYVLELDKMFMFYKFIWNGGNDRVQRACIRNNYNDCGLRMSDPYHFSGAQKMIWVKLLLDDKFQSCLKTNELSEMDRQCGDML